MQAVEVAARIARDVDLALAAEHRAVEAVVRRRAELLHPLRRALSVAVEHDGVEPAGVRLTADRAGGREPDRQAVAGDAAGAIVARRADQRAGELHGRGRAHVVEEVLHALDEAGLPNVPVVPAVQLAELGGDAFRAGARDGFFDLRFGFIRTLIGDQARAQLDDGASRDHGLGALASESAGNAVHFKRRPGPDSFQNGVFGLARQPR